MSNRLMDPLFGDAAEGKGDCGERCGLGRLCEGRPNCRGFCIGLIVGLLVGATAGFLGGWFGHPKCHSSTGVPPPSSSTASPTATIPTASPSATIPTASPTSSNRTASPTSSPTASSDTSLSLWSVSHAGEAYTLSGWGEWELVGSNIKQISLCGDRVWGVTECNDNYYFKSGVWTKFDSNLAQISCSVANTWGLNRTGGVFYLDTNDKWQSVEGDTLRQISLSADEVWGVDENQDVFHRSGPSGTWTKIDTTLQVQVSIASGHVWAVDWQDRVYYRFGTQGNWQQIGGGLAQVAARPDGGAIGVNRFGIVMAVDGPNNPGQWIPLKDENRRSMVAYDDTACDLWILDANTNVYSSCDGGNTFKAITSGYVKIAASGRRAFVLDSSENIFTCDTCAQNPSTAWTQIPGKLVDIAVSGIHIWGINATGHVLYSNSTDGNWRLVSGNRTLRSLSVSGSDIWGVDELNAVYFRDLTGNINFGEWKRVGTQLIRNISVSNGQIWGIDPANNVLYRDGFTGSWTPTNAPKLAHVAALPASGAIGVTPQRELYKVDYYTLTWTRLVPSTSYSVFVASSII